MTNCFSTSGYISAALAIMAASALASCSEPSSRTSTVQVPKDNQTQTSIPHTPRKRDDGHDGIRIGGTFSFGRDIENGPVGSVRIYPLNDTAALFYLNVNRGAPSYNMGMLYGQMTIKDNIGVYDGRSEVNGTDCLLTFKFNKDRLELKTDPAHDNCGFGHAVYADHTFVLTDEAIPQYYLSATGDTVLFNSQKP